MDADLIFKILMIWIMVIAILSVSFVYWFERGGPESSKKAKKKAKKEKKRLKQLAAT